MSWLKSEGKVILTAMQPPMPFRAGQEKREHKTNTTFKIGKAFLFTFSFSWSSFGTGATNSGKEFKGPMMF